MTPDVKKRNKTHAGNGSYGICRVIDPFPSPSPDPQRLPSSNHTRRPCNL